MCGIAGFAGCRLSNGQAEDRLRAMCETIVHRGPDDVGYYVRDGVALGMRRLSIIDVDGGQQPICNEDGTIVVVFNGEIYNHHALRRELETAGHSFRTRSDTEVLVHLFEDHGEDMISRLRGMFAFALWDAHKKKLLLARDHSGMKPLSYMALPDGLAFCSELRSLCAFQPDLLHVSPRGVMLYLAFGYVPHPETIFEGVRKLPPAHLLTWSEHRGVEVRRYWMPPRPQPLSMSEQELVEELRNRLDAAVLSHLESEVPLGAFLSGGLDSSTVVALMARHASGRVRTFSIGFAEDEFDESKAAKAVAAELGTEHTELIVRPDAEKLFEAIATMFDEPFADSSAIPTFLVAQLARQSVTVALSGDGGDELFGGYSRYREILGGSEIKHSLVRRLFSAMGLMMPHIFPGRNRLANFGRTRQGRYAATVVSAVRLDEGGVARRDQPGGTVSLADQLWERVSADLGDDFAAAMMQADLETYLPGDILTKVDRTSMAVSLEARVPFLDVGLMEFMLQLPGDVRVTAGESKRLFRKSIKGLVPDSVLSRPKQGFAIPLGPWFRGPLRHRVEALKNLSPHLNQYVDARAVNRLVFEHLIGRRNHSSRLWRLMVLDYWLASFHAGRLGCPPALP
ncbi:asparagine synthase (glutamine-hydrolyzing) [Thermodesulfobacteriota bacterium]